MMSVEPKPPARPFKGTMVKCPCGCEHEFFVPRSHHGAKAALDWNKLPDQNKELLAYLWSKYQGALWSKTEIIRLNQFPITSSPLGSRVSELYAWDLVVRHRIKTEGRKYVVKYALDLKRVRLVLENGGSLLPLKGALAA